MKNRLDVPLVCPQCNSGMAVSTTLLGCSGRDVNTATCHECKISGVAEDWKIIYELRGCLRDHFASATIMGIYANPYDYKGADTTPIRAALAYKVADAMMKERDK